MRFHLPFNETINLPLFREYVDFYNYLLDNDIVDELLVFYNFNIDYEQMLYRILIIQWKYYVLKDEVYKTIYQNLIRKIER